ncbi:MAG: carboxylating nicotinate-nucleotide diphosphorylase [Dehalococcoidia bacterium]|nr:carboxylating nicotinate-nucleotide diphosphorylase [Dehalococcoidia bacterium]
MEIDPLNPDVVAAAVRRALEEDRAFEDVTSLATVSTELTGRAIFVAKQAGVAAGFPVAAETFQQVDGRVQFEQRCAEGEAFEAGATLAVASGPVRALLQAERTSLNFVQRLSATATLTRRYVQAVAGTNAVILDTRKTTPGLRDLEKYAVRCGGGTNHRRDLAVMAMIKDNHREALAREGRSLADGVAAIRALRPGTPVEVEIDTLEQLQSALEGEPEWILLDNMSTSDMAEAVRVVAGRAKLEASGGITLETVQQIAETGVDAISVGALTHSATALDIGLDLEF